MGFLGLQRLAWFGIGNYGNLGNATHFWVYMGFMREGEI